MGYIAHDAIIVTFSDYIFDSGSIYKGDVPDIEGFRASLPEEWRQLIVGPVKSITNGYCTVVFLPDGSKEGWNTSDEGDEHRERFLDLFTWKYGDGSSPFNVVALRFGGDYGHEVGARIVFATPE